MELLLSWVQRGLYVAIVFFSIRGGIRLFEASFEQGRALLRWPALGLLFFSFQGLFLIGGEVLLFLVDAPDLGGYFYKFTWSIAGLLFLFCNYVFVIGSTLEKRGWMTGLGIALCLVVIGVFESADYDLAKRDGFPIIHVDSLMPVVVFGTLWGVLFLWIALRFLIYHRRNRALPGSGPLFLSLAAFLLAVSAAVGALSVISSPLLFPLRHMLLVLAVIVYERGFSRL